MLPFLLSATTAADFGDVQLAFGLPEPMAEMMGMMDQLVQQMESRRAPPRNPCAEDQQRLRCPSAACLIANLRSLSPMCAMLLKGRPEPSPMPAPSMDIEFGIELPNGMASTIQVEEMNGLNLGSAFPPEIASLLAEAVPMEIAQLFGEAQRQPAPRPAPRPAPQSAAAEEAAEHPCKAEVEHCIAEKGDASNGAIRACLMQHVDDPGFSSKCKCFLHQVESSSHKTQHASGPTVHVIASARPFAYEEDFRPHPMRHAFCMIFMPMMILFLALLLRRCCFFCCTSKPQFAAVVPPEQATIKTVEPLICVSVKEQIPVAPVKEQA